MQAVRKVVEGSKDFGKYRLLERIGMGGMAEVFKATLRGAEGFERLLAIKRILPNLAEDEDFAKMFIDEAKIAVQLNHPNIVGIHDLGRAMDTLFITMEYVPGKDLRALYEYAARRKSSTPVPIACHILLKMCEALHHAHFAKGPRGNSLHVIHRDVSPQNILISYDGEVKVTDFGLAKARGRMVRTEAGVLKGKLAYMAPEQLAGDPLDHRVDIFGMGIIFFELLTGNRLFLGPTDMDTLRRVYTAHIPSLQELNADIPPGLEAIVRRALAKSRDDRYDTALQLHNELQSFVYANELYAGASALRAYLREAFPESALPADAELPPFAPPARPEAKPPPVPKMQQTPAAEPNGALEAPTPSGASDTQTVNRDFDACDDARATLVPPPAEALSFDDEPTDIRQAPRAPDETTKLLKLPELTDDIAPATESIQDPTEDTLDGLPPIFEGEDTQPGGILPSAEEPTSSVRVKKSTQVVTRKVVSCGSALPPATEPSEPGN